MKTKEMGNTSQPDRKSTAKDGAPERLRCRIIEKKMRKILREVPAGVALSILL